MSRDTTKKQRSLSFSLSLLSSAVEKWDRAVQVQDNRGRLPLHYAVDKWNSKLAEYLVEKWEHWTPFHVAAHDGRLESVKHFVSCRPSTIQAKCQEGLLPVDLARRNGQPEVAEWLETSGNAAEPPFPNGAPTEDTAIASASSTEGPTTESGGTLLETQVDSVTGANDAPKKCPSIGTAVAVAAAATCLSFGAARAHCQSASE
jgi:hypothetical protein